MKRFWITSFAATFCAAVLGAQAAPPVEPPRTLDSITVTGSGKSTVRPDRVSFTAGVETTAPTVDDAVRQNNERMSSLIAALKKAGATENDLRTSTFMVFPQQVYEPNQKPRLVGFQVTNSVTVTKQNPADAGKLLTTALNAGANQVSALSFTLSDPTSARNNGLQLAVADARAKAELLARAAGRNVGRAIMIHEGVPAQPPQPIMGRTMAMEAKVADVPIESGTDELSYDVTVTFELR